MSSDEQKSFKVGFRCPPEIYLPISIILGQQLDPRVSTFSDVCNLSLADYPESVEKYVARPGVREAIQMSKALREAEYKKSVVETRYKLSTLRNEVGNGQYKAAIDGAQEDVRLFLPDGYN